MTLFQALLLLPGLAVIVELWLVSRRQSVALEAMAEALATVADAQASKVELAALQTVESLPSLYPHATLDSRMSQRGRLPEESEDDWAKRLWSVNCFQCGKPIALCHCNRASSA